MLWKTTNVIFKNSGIMEQPKCKCMLNHPSWDVFSNNCPVLTRGCLDHGTIVKQDFQLFGRRELKIELDGDYIEYGSANAVLTQNISEIQKISNQCPFNALVSQVCPSIDKSCLAVKPSDNLVTKFDVLYADKVECPCKLNVDAFSVFKHQCPVCKKNALVGEPEISQYVMFGNERSINVNISMDDNENNFLYLANQNVKKIKEIAKNCIYSRCRGQKK